MEKFPILAPNPTGRPVGSGRHGVAGAAVVALALGLASCIVELQNTQPARELARLSKPPGSVYTGWRVFQDKCASCHGPAATGGMGARDLLPKARVNAHIVDLYVYLSARADGSQGTARPAQ